MSEPHGAYRILASPLGPGFLATCPACKKRLSLELLNSRQHPVLKQVETYRCKRCGHEVEFAKELPSQAV